MWPAAADHGHFSEEGGRQDQGYPGRGLYGAIIVSSTDFQKTYEKSIWRTWADLVGGLPRHSIGGQAGHRFGPWRSSRPRELFPLAHGPFGYAREFSARAAPR